MMEGISPQDVTIQSLRSKSEALVVANQALIDELTSVSETLRQREQELATREALLKLQMTDGDKSTSEQPKDGNSIPLDQDDQLEMEKLKAHLDKEKDFLLSGRLTLNADIKRHQAIMQATMICLKKKAEEERLGFFDAVVREIELFKLPSAGKTIEGDKINDLLAEIKEIGEECLQHQENN